MVKAKTKTSLSILPAKERKFKIVSIRQTNVLPLYRKTNLNYQRVKHTNENQNCYEG